MPNKKLPNNLYKIQTTANSEPKYILAHSLINAIEVYRKYTKTMQDPEVIEWVADYLYI